MDRASVAILTLLVLGLCACGTTRPRHGVFLTPEKTQLIAQIVAEDAVNGMISLYPPANTKLKIEPLPNENERDLFGTVFLENLRRRGYAVSEITENAKQRSGNDESLGSNFCYVLDQTGENPQQYRLTIQVGTQFISRAYEQQAADKIVPVSYWARKE